MKESALVDRILRALRLHTGCYAIKLYVSPFNNAGQPDIYGCYHGRMFALEVKVGKNKPTHLQALRLQEWHDAGAFTTVAREDFDVDQFLESMREVQDET